MLRLLARRWIREVRLGGADWADWLGTELMIGCKQINKEGQLSTNLFGEFVQKTKTSPLMTLITPIYTDQKEFKRAI
jgi:hypothetical protein